MKPPSDPRWEEQLQRLARTFPYPPTPDLAAAVERHLAEQSTKRQAIPNTLMPPTANLGCRHCLLLLLAGLLATPQVRAAKGWFPCPLAQLPD